MRIGRKKTNSTVGDVRNGEAFWAEGDLHISMGFDSNAHLFVACRIRDGERRVFASCDVAIPCPEAYVHVESRPTEEPEEGRGA